MPLAQLLPGMAFRCMEPPRHIYIPIFDSENPGDEMLLVNFTTLREGCIDDACILQPADYPELKHTTTVAFSLALVGRQSAFIKAVNAGHFIQLDDLSEETWEKIVSTAHLTDELSKVKKRLLPPVAG